MSPPSEPSPARLRIEVFTIFPEVIDAYCSASIVGRARRDGLIDLRVHDLRSGATDLHRSVDDAPFGGGPGMVLAPEPVFRAVETADPPHPLYLLSPAGRRFDQACAAELAGLGGSGREPPAFSLLCGRYEGVDQRIADHLVDGELSVGDFVLAGGEAAALVVIEASVGSSPASSATTPRRATRASPPGSSSIPSTRGRRTSGAGRSPTCCAAATTAGSSCGGRLRHFDGRSSAGRT